MDNQTAAKYAKLKDILSKLESVIIAFSGGVDSTFLLKVAKDVLGGNVLAVTATSKTYPQHEKDESESLAKTIGVRQLFIDSHELEVEGFSENPVNRCYFCKKELFTLLREIADKNDIRHVAEGSTFDDLNDFRPGMKAVSELGVVSPLKESEFTKDEIRIVSKELELPTWNKPSFACLSSRFPYGEAITEEKLLMAGKAEDFLRTMGFSQYRVRHHEQAGSKGYIARIEVIPDDLISICSVDNREKIVKYFKSIGYDYVSVDLQGYRTGSMNEILSPEVVENE